MSASPSVYDFDAIAMDGRTVHLSDYRHQVLLIVNTASQCGFTPQYKGLQALHEQFGDKGLVVLGFPCNQFGGQEPGTDADIASFCELNHGVTFGLMRKVEVNGPDAHPLYRWLCQQAPGLLGSKAIKWNFTKFLVGRDGTTIERFAPQTDPASLASAIERALAT